MRILIFLMAILFISCSQEAGNNEVEKEEIPQAYGLDGKPYYLPERSEEASRSLNEKLEAAKSDWERNPSEENFIWYGRRMAYTNRYNEAIEIFTEGIRKFPESYRLYRHRGHRYISLRKLDKAVSDLTKSASLIGERDIEVEPDGMPNTLNIPLSNTHFNIYYHLGLAYYLKSEWELAEIAYRQCMEYSINDDLKTATADWLYMTLMKQGKAGEAIEVLEGITEQMEVIENDSYYQRLLMYKGILPPGEVFSDQLDSVDDVTIATQGYGVGNYYLQKGDTLKAREILTKVVSGKSWSAFGFIAAEAELLRLGE